MSTLLVDGNRCLEEISADGRQTRLLQVNDLLAPLRTFATTELHWHIHSLRVRMSFKELNVKQKLRGEKLRRLGIQFEPNSILSFVLEFRNVNEMTLRGIDVTRTGYPPT